MATSPVQGRQFRDVFDRVITHSSTLDLASAPDSGFAASDVTVPGAALGDFVLCSLGVDVVDTVVKAEVTAANVVTVVVQNDTGGAVDLASTTCRIVVLKPNPSAFL